MKCYYTLDPKTKKRVFIPMCIGTIHSEDIDDCHCPQPLTEHHFAKERFNKVLKEKNDTIAAQQSELNHLRKILKISQK